MTDDARDSLDRRDLFLATLMTAGAAASLAAPALAQSTLAPPPPGSATVFTGDVIQGRRVVSALDVNDLAPGQKHALYFQGVQGPSGQHWYVSVLVARGARPGRRVLLTSGVHGDEMSSIHTVQSVMNALDPAQMSGTVTAVFDIARPAIEAMARRWPNSGRGTDLIDLNREWPGHESGASAPARHAGLLFNRLLRPNADVALDFHTGTSGIDVTSFHLAEMGRPEVRAMAELFPIAQVFDSPGYPGLLCRALMDAGIPALTPEVGAARVLDRAMAALFVEGTLNVMKLQGVVPGPMGRTGRESGLTIGNSAHPVLATHGGIVELLVGLNETVEAGQKLAIQRNMFGEVVAEYASGVAGRVTGRRSDATAEPGNVLYFIVHNRPPAEDARSYPE